MKARYILVNLDFVHHVDMGFSAQFGAAQGVERDIFVLALLLVVDGHRAGDAALLEHPLDERVEPSLAKHVLGDGKAEVRALDDVEGEADQRGLDFLVGILDASGFFREVMDVRDAFLGDRDVGHCQGLEVGNAAAQGAEDHEGIAGRLEILREVRRADGLKFFSAEENRVVVHGFHHGHLALLAELAEWRLDDLIVLLEGIEECLQDLHLRGHGVEAQALGREGALVHLLIEGRAFFDVEVFVKEEVAEVHQEVGRHFAGDCARDALDDEVAFEFAGDGDEVVIAGLANDTVAEGLIGVALEASIEGFLGRARFLNGVLELLDGALEDFAG